MNFFEEQRYERKTELVVSENANTYELWRSDIQPTMQTFIMNCYTTQDSKHYKKKEKNIQEFMKMMEFMRVGRRKKP